ncbi:MAG TPA: SH3 domain-containing protein [Longimicrobium sp.]|jgi:hypothetical protein|nr:SH3 domain-containing protein [Longimicrobium sp.]
MPLLIGIAVAILLAVILGVVLVIVLDTMAQGFLWVVPVAPPGGWLLLGTFIGALIGLAVGFRRGGRPLGVIGVLAPISLAALLLVAGIRYPESSAGNPGPQAWAFQARVTAEDLNIRTGPDREAPVVGRVHEGAVLQIGESSGDWYRVLASPGIPAGWVNGKYTYRL